MTEHRCVSFAFLLFKTRYVHISIGMHDNGLTQIEFPVL